MTKCLTDEESALRSAVLIASMRDIQSPCCALTVMIRGLAAIMAGARRLDRLPEEFLADVMMELSERFAEFEITRDTRDASTNPKH